MPGIESGSGQIVTGFKPETGEPIVEPIPTTREIGKAAVVPVDYPSDRTVEIPPEDVTWQMRARAVNPTHMVNDRGQVVPRRP